MATFEDMYKRYMAALRGGRLIERAIMNTDQELIAVNQKNLLQGVNAIGNKIEPKYKLPSYALYKERKNSLPGYGTPDLYNTGAFHSKIDFHITGYRLVWENFDEKSYDLKRKYGPILGVFEGRYMIRYRTMYLYPALAQELRLQTGMK